MRRISRNRKEYLLSPYHYDILRDAADILKTIAKDFGEDFKDCDLLTTSNNIYKLIKDTRIDVNLG